MSPYHFSLKVLMHLPAINLTILRKKKSDGAKNTENKGILEARKKWVSTPYQKGEGDDSANQLCFREEPFKKPEFEQIASAVYHPFLKVSEVGKEEDS